MTATCPPETAQTIDFDRVSDWMFDAALPFWSTTGFDEDAGVSRERVALDGQIADPGFRRIRAMARQIYVFSHAQTLDWNTVAAAQVADRTLDYMTNKAWLGAEAGWARRLSDDGRIEDATPDLYDQAFALFALAWRYRASRKDAHRSLALETLDFIRTRMAAEDGLGFAETLPPGSRRIQNPHMHLLEALIVLARDVDAPRIMETAQHIADLYADHVVDAGSGALREFFGPGWTVLDTPEGHVTEPGHHFEWVWILNEFGKAGGSVAPGLVDRLFDFALAHGIAPGHGLTYDQIGDDGAVLKPSFRSWPQTETLKALLAMGERRGEFETGRIAQTVENIFRFYLDPAPSGLWRDQLDTERRSISTFTPSTTLYHLFLAFAELLRLRPSIEAATR